MFETVTMLRCKLKFYLNIIFVETDKRKMYLDMKMALFSLNSEVCSLCLKANHRAQIVPVKPELGICVQLPCELAFNLYHHTLGRFSRR